MKKLLFAISILLSISLSAQNYNDSIVTLNLTQLSAIYIGRSIQQSFSWQNRNAPTQLKAYIGSGANYDSLIGNVSVKVSYVKGMIEMLLNLSGSIVEADKLSIINNIKIVGGSIVTIPGYTALANQINTKANGSSSEKQVAIFIRDYYNERVAAYGAVRSEAINSTVQWANN